MFSEELPSVLRSAIENTDYSIVITTGDLNPPGPLIVYTNSAFTRMTGYASEEILYSSPRTLQGPATEPNVLAEMKAALWRCESFEGCTWNYAKDGRPYQVEWTVTPVCLNGKRPDYFVSIQRDVTARYQSYDRLKSETRRLNSLLQSVGANRDGITGTHNHRGMLLRLQELLDGLGETQAAAGVLCLQLKSVTRLDQTFGTDAVNRLLQVIADRLSSQLKAKETLAHPHEHAFMILLPIGVDAVGDVDRYLKARAKSLIGAITDEAIEMGGEVFHIEAGAGIARSPVDGCDCQKLATLADQAAQRTKNAVHWADHAMATTQLEQIRLERKLLEAIAGHKIVVFYQPIMDLDSNKVLGAEALARWPQPDGHPPIGPDRFIPLAEALGAIDQLGMQVFEQACWQLKSWQELPGNAALWVSVNVAPAQLGDPHLAERFTAITQKIGVSPASVKLEITESALENGLDSVVGVIDKLVAADFPLALDDFGTGHSSLKRLIEIPFNILKADKCFVSELPDGRGAAVVSSLSHLSEHLSIHALGEGVETAAHEAFLRDCNYRYAQGYYYAKPMAPDDFVAWSEWPAKSIERSNRAY